MIQENQTPKESVFSANGDLSLTTERIRTGNLEKRFETFFNSASLGLAAADLHANYIAVNDAYCRLVGYTKEELSGMNMRSVTHPDDIASNFGLLDQLRAGTISSFELQKRYVQKNGQVIWGRIHVSLLKNDLNEPEGFIATTQDISQEIKMREEQEKLLSITENSLDLVLVSNIDGRITYVNKSGRALLGIDNQEQSLNTRINDYFGRDMQSVLTEEVLPSLMNEGKWSGKIWFRHFKSGERIPTYLNASRIDDPQTGEPTAFSGVARDLRSEMEAMKEQQELITLLENTSDFVALSDLEGNIHYVNEAGRNLMGLSQIEEAFRPYFEYLMPEEADRIQHDFNLALLEKGRWTAELLYKNFSTGEAIPVWCTTMLVYDPGSGEAQGRATIARDLRKEKNAQKALKESAEQLSLAIESAEMGTWSIHLLKNEVYFSDRICSWYGFAGSEINFEKGFLAIHPDDRERVQLNLAEALSSGGDFYVDEYRIRNLQNGQERIVRPAGKIFFNEEGIPFLIRGIVQDVTTQRRTREELERQVNFRTEELAKANEVLKRTNEELEQFAYAASHDMQEPLRKIQTFISLLVGHSGQELSVESKTYLSKIRSSAERMKMIIDDLLNYSNQTRTDVARIPTDLNTVIGNVLNDLDLLVEQKSAQISYDRLPVIESIPSQMNQLFYNLIGNALKFSKNGVIPQVHIRYAELTDVPGTEPVMEISIKDNGIGFNPRFAQQVFGLFQRLNGRSSYTGTGIGLALCKKIVQNHGGSITADAKEGEGASFYIRLPMKMKKG